MSEIRLSGDDSWHLLLCPRCGGNNTHIVRVRPGRGIQRADRDEVCVALDFECEHCGNDEDGGKFTIAAFNHKGETHLTWSYGDAREDSPPDNMVPIDAARRSRRPAA